MALILNGAPVAAALMGPLAGRVGVLKNSGIIPTLAIVRMSEEEGELAYERAAIRRCEGLGLRALSRVLPPDGSEGDILALIDEINGDDSVHGCLILRPLPKHIDERRVCDRLAADKDVDCVSAGALSHVFTGEKSAFAPCTAQACIEILDYYACEIPGANIAVLGRSLVVGRPLSIMLQDRNATVTMCHSKTRNLPQLCRGQDILIAAIGSASMIDGAFINEQQTIIDVGINLDESGRLCGDVRFEEVSPRVKAISPVPGGVGSITTTILAKHVIEAAERRL